MLTIQRAQLDDADQLTAIKTAAYNLEINTYFGRDGGPPGYNDVNSQISIIINCIAYKIVLDTTIIGAFFLIPLEDSCMRFEDFVIQPSYQGLGYGYLTMQLLEKEYPSIHKWLLSTPIFSLRNQYLYKKFGYCEILRNQVEIEYCKLIQSNIY